MANVPEKSSATLASFVIILPTGRSGQLAEGIRTLHAAIHERYTFFEIILVDDSGSHEHGVVIKDLLKQTPFLHYIRLNRPFGQEIASYAGLDQAIGDHVVVAVLGQDPLERLPEIIGICQLQNKVVFGRALNKPHGGWVPRMGERLFRHYLKRILNVTIDPDLTHLVAMPRSVVNQLLKVRDPSGYLSVQSGYVGVERTYVEYALNDPEAFQKDRGLARSVQRGVNIIAQNSVHPLRFLTWIGALGALFNLLYAVFITAIFFFKDDYAPGWVALSGQQAIYFFFTCTFFVVISEYMGQIMITVKDRPLYFVAERAHSNVLEDLTARRNVVDE
ncbi:MAG: glycosyltransferase [Flavobacteriales bacterium]|nr:glycosyltransferase [Flavobacteriales bacterium]